MMSLLRGAHAGHHDVSPSKQQAPEPAVKEIVPSPPASERPDPLTQSQQFSSMKSPIKTESLTVKRRSRPSSGVRTTSGRYVTTYVKEQHSVIRDQCRQKLGAGLSTNVFDTSFVGLLEWIRSERLTRIPHKGGAWDRVLSAAQYFAEQVQSLHLTTQNFTAGTDSAATLVFGQCLLLLELGHENATALRKVFKLFYQFGNELSLLLKQAELFALDVAIQDGVGTAFVDLLNIVTGVAVQFHLAVHGAKESVALDIYASFGGLITAFRAQVAKVAQHMWAASLERAGLIDGPTVDVLRNWLAPQDSVLAFLSSNHVNLANQAADHTCVWFQQHLSSFLRGNDKIMVVEGKQGSGKSTMANWVTDRLQRPIGGRNRKVSTISFAFNQTIRAQSTSLSLVKTLLYQLLEQQIGDLEVYEAIEHAYRELSSSRDAKVHEEKLWTAMTSCLQAINERSDSETLVMVIDGVDEGAGMLKGASAICQRLHSVAQRFASVRLLQFSTPLEMSTPKSSVRLSLTAAQTADDLRMLIRQSLESNTCFRELNEEEQDKMAERLVSAAEGSMLWAGLASHLLRLQKTQSSLMQTCESLQAASKTIPEAVQKLLSAMQLSQDSKSLISWLCAAERPLSFAEIKLLLQASPEKGFMVDRVVDVQGLIRSIRPFVVVGEGLVAIRHVAIERALINMSGNMKALLHLTDRHHDLLARLLIYSKNCTRDEHDVSFTSWSFSLVAQRFHKHQLLEYSVRYWAEHLRSIPSYKANEDLSQFAPAFREIFPSSVTFAILERTCWNSTSFLTDVLGLHLVATRLRQAVFGQTHICVLQSMISYADLCEVLSKSHDSCKYYSLACKLSRTLLGVQSQVTITCSTSLLRISETLVTNSRTEIMTYREETYMLLIECYKHTYGATSVQALEIYKKLAEFYVFIAEETKATEIYKIIQTITVTIYGEHSDEAKSISGHLGVVLRKHEHSHEIEGYEGSFFSGFWEQTTEEFSLTVVERIILIATTHIARGEFAVAEELYAELWLRLTEQCRVTEVLEWHTKKIEVMLIYAEFLMSHKRTTEASSLLLCIWREYEFHAFSAVESIVLQLKEVAVLMKKVSLLTVSLSVFKKCWSFFKSTHKTESSVYREIEEHITVTSKEVVERSSTTQITSTSSETVIREVFESSISSSTTEVSSTTIELCKSLTSVYIKQERYSEAIKCIKSVVKKSWASFFSSTFEATSSSISSSSIDLVVQLAVCYIKQSRFEKAEHIYVQLYRCIRSAYRLDHELVIKYSETLLEFYKSHKMFTKAISFYQELLVEYRSFYGNTHSITIKTLYALGDMCRLHHRTHGYWIEYYLEIITCLNKGATICHHDALRALVAVAECYFEDCRYSESFTYYKLIAATFFKHGVSYECFKQTSEVQMIFEHYERSMIESKVEFSVQLTMLKEYHEACTRHFGAAHSITIAATLQYASICMKSESHQLEAISLYEHISKHSSSTEIITQCKSTLRSLYVKQTTTQSSTTVSKTMIESATTLVCSTPQRAAHCSLQSLGFFCPLQHMLDLSYSKYDWYVSCSANVRLTFEVLGIRAASRDSQDSFMLSRSIPQLLVATYSAVLQAVKGRNRRKRASFFRCQVHHRDHFYEGAHCCRYLCRLYLSKLWLFRPRTHTDQRAEDADNLQIWGQCKQVGVQPDFCQQGCIRLLGRLRMSHPVN